MSWYEFLLFVHVSAAVIWLGGGFIFQAYGMVVRSGGDAREIATFAGRAGRLGEKVFTTASLFVLLAGVGLMIEGSLDWGRLWVVFALVVFAASFVNGLFVITPMAKRLEQVGPETPAGQELIQRLFLTLRLELLFLFAVVFAMTVKPTFDDGWTVAIAAALLGAAAALILLSAGARGSRTAVRAEG